MQNPFTSLCPKNGLKLISYLGKTAAAEETCIALMEIEQLKQRVVELEKENAALRGELLKGQAKRDQLSSHGSYATSRETLWERDHSLNASQVQRYGRQLILPSFGPRAQEQLCKGSVLVVGAGGLGSSALLYLVGAGIGKLGIVDKDTVALNNLHRQIIHSEESIGEDKTVSAKRACQRLNSSVHIEIHPQGIMPQNALEIVGPYDVVVDASDNAPTRYLISDACVLMGKPLVSGAAIGTDGQLTVYNHGPDGPCYRCLLPKAPPPGACSRCSEAGVLGPVPGIIGTLQALEAIKILTEVGTVLSRRMLIMDSLEMEFRTIKIRGRNSECVACGPRSSLTRENLVSYNYVGFTGQCFTEDPEHLPLQLLPPSERLSPRDLLVKIKQKGTHPFVLLDVRPQTEFAICRLKGSMLCPFLHLIRHLPSVIDTLRREKDQPPETGVTDMEVVVVCRRGQDSQIAVAELRKAGIHHAVDLIGGLEAWHHELDPTFLKY